MGRARNRTQVVAASTRRRASAVAVASTTAPSVDSVISAQPLVFTTERDPDAPVYPLRIENVRARGPVRCMKEGRIIVARSQKEIDDVISRWKLVGPQPLAHDLECAPSPTVPNGTGLHPHLGTIRLAQFAVADGGNGRPEALVFDLWRFDPARAVELLADPAYLKIIHFAQMETRWIGYLTGQRIENMVDTCSASKLIYKRHGFTAEPLEEDLERLGADEASAQEAIEEEREKLPAAKGIRHALGVVAKRDLDIELNKEMQVSYWDATRLNREQEQYAGEDVLILLDLWERQREYLTEEDFDTLRQSARDLNDKTAGINAKEANRRNIETLLEHGLTEADFPEGVIPEHYLQALAEHGELTVPYTPPAKGCESGRALRMISACRNKRELDKCEHALPFMRIHFTNRQAVDDALRRRARKLGRRTSKTERYPSRVQVAGWQQPF